MRTLPRGPGSGPLAAAAGAFALAGAITLGACGGGGATHTATGAGSGAVPAPARRVATLTLRSSAIAPGARIPARYTCDGPDISPPLSWTQPPAGAREELVSMVDLDAPQRPFVHWALAGLPPAVLRLAAGAAPAGSTAGANDFGMTGYGGPCPPRGSPPHRYRLEVDALDQTVPVTRGFGLVSLTSRLGSHVVARGQLFGLYR